MNNDHGESPCQVASELASLCSPGGKKYDPILKSGNQRSRRRHTGHIARKYP